MLPSEGTIFYPLRAAGKIRLMRELAVLKQTSATGALEKAIYTKLTGLCRVTEFRVLSGIIIVDAMASPFQPTHLFDSVFVW